MRDVGITQVIVVEGVANYVWGSIRVDRRRDGRLLVVVKKTIPNHRITVHIVYSAVGKAAELTLLNKNVGAGKKHLVAVLEMQLRQGERFRILHDDAIGVCPRCVANDGQKLCSWFANNGTVKCEREIIGYGYGLVSGLKEESVVFK